MLLSIHIAAGGLAIVLGAAALLARKGGTIHRRSGLLFVGAMIVMGASASILGFRKSPSNPNVPAGFMTAYFVGTALTTVRPASRWTRGINMAALPIPVGLTILNILGGIRAFANPRGVLNGAPFPMFFFLAGITLLAAVGDVRIMLSGMPRGGARLARHLGACASRYLSRPDRSFRSAHASRKSFPLRSRLGRCAPYQSCSFLRPCSIGCGRSAAARRQCSCGTIRCRSLTPRVEMERTWTIIGVGDVPGSFKWYRTLFGHPPTDR